jgi:hypothetical protein
MTSDGISDEDWAVVRELAVDVVNGGTDDKVAITRSRLLTFLDNLEAKYGTLPSILAMRADFVDDPIIKESLFTEGYAIAEGLRDKSNVLHIAHSLAELFIDERDDVVKGEEWLRRLKAHLDENHDDDYARDYERLRKKVEQSQGGA